MTEDRDGDRIGVSRRNLLRAGGAGVALGALAPAWGALSPATAQVADAEEGGGDPAEDDPEIRLENIQGNVLGGFNKDHQRLLFVRFGQAWRARRWLDDLIDEVATAEEVLGFNAVFRGAAERRADESSTPTATWMNVALTHTGLAALGVPAGELGSFPMAFRQGMPARAQIVGDTDMSAPHRWVGLRDPNRVHAVLILAADRGADLDRLVENHRTRLASAQITTVFDQRGRTRVDQPGHEHFGFRDGISQPGVRGVTARENPDDDGQGLPGQDLLWPGEFVLGYPTQIGTTDPANDEGGNEAAGPTATSGPAWTADGSYLVFRRLRQDVAGFRQMVAAHAAAQGITTDQMGAKLVGRYPSGAPLERVEGQSQDVDTTAGDPSVDDATLLDADRINHFEFAEDDNDGAVVPRSAHIRKVYPRDTETPTGREADTQTHRLLRRGIPYGQSYVEGSPATSASGSRPPYPNDRGLLFLCYQTSIERQFEFVMSRWVNDPDAPGEGGGHDPIIAQQDRTRTFSLPGGQPDHIQLMQRFVTTTAGAYLFQPSISALRRLAAAPPRPQAPASGPAPTRHEGADPSPGGGRGAGRDGRRRDRA